MFEKIVKQRLNPLIEMAHISESKVRKALEKAKVQSNDFTTSNLKKQLAKNEKRLSDIERIFGKLYEDRALETITEQNYTMLSTKLQAEQQTLAQEVEQAKERLALKEQDTESIANFVDIIKSMKRIEKMDAQILNTLGDKKSSVARFTSSRT